MSLGLRVDEQTQLAHEIARAAVRFNELRLSAIELRTRRGKIECEHGDYSMSEMDDPTEPMAIYVNYIPCWKAVGFGPEGDYRTHRPRNEWCPACARRQELHNEYQRTACKRGAALRQIEALSRRYGT